MKNTWTLHERSATLKTPHDGVVSNILQYVSQGLITVAEMSREDGMNTLEIYVTPSNNFRRTINFLIQDAASVLYNT